MTETTQLTGQEVEERRNALHLSRREFAELCGFPTQTRLFNIEKKDSWKSGDQEAVAAAFERVAANPPAKSKRSRNKQEAEDRVTRLEEALRAKQRLARELTDPDEVAEEITITTGDPDLEDPPSAVWTEPNQTASLGEHSITTNGARITEPIETLCPACGAYMMSWKHYTECLGGPVTEPEEPTEDEGEEQPPSIEVDLEFENAVKELRGTGDKLLTNSEVAVWNRCRRKWWLAFYRELAYGQIDYSGPREIGNRVHRALAAWYVPEGATPQDPREALEAAIAQDWVKIEESIRSFGVAGDVEQVLQDRAAKFNQACQLERTMIEGYVEWLQETAQDANLRVTEPEAIIHAKIEGEVAGEKVEFTGLGKLDARLRRASDGVRLFMDHKTAGSLTDPLKTLHMDAQMLHYHLLEFLNSSEGDERCDAALYNLLKKVKRGTTAKPPFFDRVEVHHNPHEIESYRKRLLGAARDIARATRELDAGHEHLSIVYPHPTKNCSWDCDFFVICPMFDDGSRVEDAISAHYHQQDPLARYAKDQEVGGI